MGLLQDLKGTIDPAKVKSDYGTDLNQLPDKLLTNLLRNIVMPLLGVAAVVSIVYGGYLYITSGGDPEKAQKGKRVIIYSVIAIVILVLSYVIYNTVLNCVDPTSGAPGFACPN